VYPVCHKPRSHNFFCRAYTLKDGGEEQEDSAATNDMRLISIQTIKGLFENTEGHPGISASRGRSLVRNGVTVDQSFSAGRIRTRRQWIEEERGSADSLARIYRVKMTYLDESCISLGSDEVYQEGSLSDIGSRFESLP
jgi:hypothetical protein